jgi:hypothetical protein
MRVSVRRSQKNPPQMTPMDADDYPRMACAVGPTGQRPSSTNHLRPSASSAEKYRGCAAFTRLPGFAIAAALPDRFVDASFARFV